MADPSEMTLDKDETLKTTVLDLLQKGDSRKRSLPKHLRCTKILIDLFPKPYKLKSHNFVEAFAHDWTCFCLVCTSTYVCMYDVH